jgi:hypothetical protein
MVQQIDVEEPPKNLKLYITVNGEKEYLCDKPCLVSAPFDTEIKWRAVVNDKELDSSYFRMGETILPIRFDPIE